MPYDDNNIFAKILRGEIPCGKIYEDDFALAFHDIRKQAAVHALVIPKGRYTDFPDFVTNAAAAEVAGFLRAVVEVTRLLGVADSGYRLISNTGPDSRQEVPHYHEHILGGERLGAFLTPVA